MFGTTTKAMSQPYLFTSARLGFRNWLESDLPAMAAMNEDKAVMTHFPQALQWQESEALLYRLQNQYHEKGFTYFATCLLETGDFLGFIGLSHQNYEAPFTPAIDIGWRLQQSAWGKGYATEGANACLDFAFQSLSVDRIVSVCPVSNIASEKVMQKIGMSRQGVFSHPALANYPTLQSCVWYEKKRSFHSL